MTSAHESKTKPIVVPDATRLQTVQRVCDLTDPYLFGPDADRLFATAMSEITEWHAGKSGFYGALLMDRRIDPRQIKTLEDCAKIPFVPAQFFKTHELLSVSPDQVAMRFTSSGTSGQKSQMFFDDWSLRSGQRMVDSMFGALGWINPGRPVNYLLYSYETEPDTNLGTAYTDNFLCKYAPVRDGFYAIRRTGTGGHDFDPFGCIERLKAYEKEGSPVRIFGFPSFLFFTLKRMRELGSGRLKLNPASVVMLGGGWKGHADQAVSKDELYGSIQEQLGIPTDRIRDSFGAVEHGVPYMECERHHFHVPVWSRVIIRDVRTLEPLSYGQRGFLQFLTPFVTSVPAHSLLMGDLATLYPPEDCGCGIKSPYFVVHGRAGTSKNRSCAVAASELLGR